MIKFLSRLIKISLLFIAVGLILRFYIMPQILFPLKYSDQVEKYSEKYNTDKYLIYAIIKTESNFNQNAVSPKNAKGLMQVTEVTGIWAAENIGIKDFSTDKLFDPDTNIEIGCWYISKLMRQFNCCNTAIAAYNAGSGNVSRWLEDNMLSNDGLNLDSIPYSETENYVRKINITKKIYEYLYSKNN
ncbi:MAG: lytic transglycosylase domain-containing protein [Clostridia bacterium]|jgi:soluble lytic murein transglycosylase|nr:lytic transglycosylase domain-containing protein [Clostridia bacterium]